MRGRPGVIAKPHVVEGPLILWSFIFRKPGAALSGGGGALASRVIVNSVLVYRAADIAKEVTPRAVAPLVMVSIALLIATMATTPAILISSSIVLVSCVVAWMCTTPVGALVRGAIKPQTTANVETLRKNIP